MENPDSTFFYKLIKKNKGENIHQGTVTLDVGGIESDNPVEQRRAFANFYEDLAVPKENDRYDVKTLEASKTRCGLIENLAIYEREEIMPFTTLEVGNAIKTLNNNKASDEYGLSAEHIKFAGEPLVDVLTDLFNQILKEGNIPDIFKTGYITPVFKKGKNLRKVESYRGITVASIFGKIFEKLLLIRLSAMNRNQSNLQFGFTKDTSPAIAALLVSEAALDSKQRRVPFILGTLDSQKAFDVVHHDILLDKLYHTGINLSVWKLVKGMYEGLTSKVKWKGDYSLAFPVNQGVRQGGILSTHLYKLYINELLLELEENQLGKYVGITYAGCPTVADDLSLMSECTQEFGAMLNVAHSYACRHRYIIHPEKSVVITKQKVKTEDNLIWKLGDEPIAIAEETIHLGLLRCTRREPRQNVTHKISTARRTLYSLLNVGCHGLNGLNPKTSTKIYQVYVIPIGFSPVSKQCTCIKEISRSWNFFIEKHYALSNQCVQHLLQFISLLDSFRLKPRSIRGS
ncbi:hypothetical protein FSP39_007606 [Pinctada imbricata]|uniref:Reverse transcriptase domain-containing protein n=1 Tax=Pinctada imbricata TaxID=66713 RepID=A0AA88Y5B0_PINIB|nr:hypothetical protein FSP39_007606 [Pinctada imbricata]